jgi:TolB protein
MYKYCILSFCFIVFSNACKTHKNILTQSLEPAQDTLKYAQEKHFKNVRQLTFGGDNAEAYWSFDHKKVVFQATNKMWGANCDQIYYFNLDQWTNDKKSPPRLSTGQGRTTCSFFMKDNQSIVYASTHEANAACPQVPERRTDGKYIWPVYETFDIYHGDLKGKIIKKLTNSPGYDAEATVSPDGNKIVFTSTRSGDLELWTMDVDGSNLHQVTNQLGYDGGAFFSPDGKKLVFRASRPTTEADIKVYKDLLAQGQVMPTSMELYTCNVDGSNLKQLTSLGKANWAPYFLPKGDKVIFSSNHAAPRGYQFNLYTIKLDGTGLEQVTFDKTFDSFPMFSYDGKKLIFASNRNNGGTRDTNLFIADWVD